MAMLVYLKSENAMIGVAGEGTGLYASFQMEWSNTMNISLTAEQEKWIQDKVTSGEYPSEATVIDEALRLLQKRDRRKNTQRVCMFPPQFSGK